MLFLLLSGKRYKKKPHSSSMQKTLMQRQNPVLWWLLITASQGTDQLHKGLDGINDSVSDTNVPQKAPSVNSSSTQEIREYTEKLKKAGSSTPPAFF